MAKKKSHNTNKKSATNPLPWVAGALFVFGLAVIAGFYWNSMMKVKKVYFEGNDSVSEEQLREVEVPTDIHPDSLNTLDIISQLEQIPYVKQAAVNVEPSGNLTIQISEREPIAMLSDGDEEIYIDQEGIRLPMTLGKSVNVPLLYGFDAQPIGDTLSGRKAEAMTDFLTQLHQNPVGDATISEVVWTNDGVVALTNQYGVKLIFGEEDFANRIRNWEAFYTTIIKQKGIESMRSVDLRFQGQIVTQEEHE